MQRQSKTVTIGGRNSQEKMREIAELPAEDLEES